MSEDSSDYPQSLTPWFLHHDYDFEEQIDLPDREQPSEERTDKEAVNISSDTGENAESNIPQDASAAADVQQESDSRARRRVQNRVAQRAFRERKQSYAKDLESRVRAAEERVRILTAEKSALEHVLQRAQTDNQRLQHEVSQRPEHPIATTLLDWKARRQKSNIHPDQRNRNP